MLTMALIGIPAAPPASAQSDTCTAEPGWGRIRAEFVVEVVRLTNDHRATLGLPALKASRSLTRAAIWKVLHMSEYGYIAHDDPSPPYSRTFSQRVQDCGYPYPAGENLGLGYSDPADVMSGWLNSPGHRANIERADYDVIGVGVGMSENGTLAWAQVFGTEDDSGRDVHSPPTAQPDAIEIMEDGAAEVSVLENDSDPEGDALGILDVAETSVGTASIVDGLTIIYSPPANFNGADSFTYEITDLFGFTATGSVDIKVTPVNDLPDVLGERVTAHPRQWITISVLDNDSDVDGDQLSLGGLDRTPLLGRVEFDETAGVIRYRAHRGTTNRRDQIGYTVTDGNGASGSASVRIRIIRRG